MSDALTWNPATRQWEAEAEVLSLPTWHAIDPVLARLQQGDVSDLAQSISAYWVQHGPLVLASFLVTCSGTGQAAHTISIDFTDAGLPASSGVAAYGGTCIGVIGGTPMSFLAQTAGVPVLAFLDITSNTLDNIGTGSGQTLQSGDVIGGTFFYEAA